MRRLTKASIILIIMASLCSACASTEGKRYSMVETEKGTYIVDKKIGQSYKYPPDKPAEKS